VAELENALPPSVPMREDPPQPDLPDLQQREVYDVPAVPVCIDGTTDVHVIPNKRFSVSNEPVGANTGLFTRILTADPTRRRAVVMLQSATATDTFSVSSSASGQSIPWPANVAMVLEHCDEVWARSGQAQGAVIGVLIENWAD